MLSAVNGSVATTVLRSELVIFKEWNRFGEEGDSNNIVEPRADSVEMEIMGGGDANTFER